MAAAKGPPCEVCHKRVSVRRVTRCPWCRRILCLNCTCPNLCYKIAERMTTIQKAPV